MALPDVLQVLADPNRARILEVLRASEKTVTDLTRATRLRQPLVSHHLRVLREAGLVEVRKEGRYRMYKASAGEVGRQLAKLEESAKALEAAADAKREAAGAGAGDAGAKPKRPAPGPPANR